MFITLLTVVSDIGKQTARSAFKDPSLSFISVNISSSLTDNNLLGLDFFGVLEKFLRFCEEYFFGPCQYFIFGAFFLSSLNKTSKAALFGNPRKVLIFLSLFKSLALNAGGCLFTNFFHQNATSLLSFSTSFFKKCISFSLADIMFTFLSFLW